jgi:putative AdoMet-dependent methyltransferase
MLNSVGFDLWADGYDRAVGLSDEQNTYPFAGYKAVLGRIYETVIQKPHAAVLDLGFGTGTLTAKLYERGCAVFGQDFSARMIERASEKMPKARLFQGDLAKGLCEPLLRQSYDFIVATYSLHHLTDERKVALLQTLTERLKEGGQILIGDVAFETRGDLERCKAAAGGEWDDEEIYCVADELRKAFPALRFEQISHCAGILSLSGNL